MILNCVSNDGNVIDLQFPENTSRKDTENTPFTDLRKNMAKLLDSYRTQIDECQKVLIDADACIDQVVNQTSNASVKYLTEAFFTRDNYCFTNYIQQAPKKKGSYYVEKFHGIMIHSPASCQNALITRRNSFNQYSKKGEKIGTHFIVDGDTGHIYCLLPLDCLANHCGTPMADSSTPVPGTVSLNSKLISIDIGEPSGVLCISSEQAMSFPQTYRQTIWRKSGSHYYGIAERISSTNYNSLEKEERREWTKGTRTTEKGETVNEYFRSTPEYIERVRAGVTTAYTAAAELTAGLCYLYGFNPLHKGKKLSFDEKKKKYSET
ncbi:MAG: N-acetylmuramoyl-L-alanine amidase [Oscillospiraceae bacterium]|nr:N-acetylmuramoyl-L-alanine amidase [Oscillospiraceae bacterium]